MKITKDEAAILYQCIYIAKYEINYPNNCKIFESFLILEKKLDSYSNDKRRTGRTSQNSFTDILKRYAKQVLNESATTRPLKANFR